MIKIHPYSHYLPLHGILQIPHQIFEEHDLRKTLCDTAATLKSIGVGWLVGWLYWGLTPL